MAVVRQNVVVIAAARCQVIYQRLLWGLVDRQLQVVVEQLASRHDHPIRAAELFARWLPNVGSESQSLQAGRFSTADVRWRAAR